MLFRFPLRNGPIEIHLAFRELVFFVTLTGLVSTSTVILTAKSEIISFTGEVSRSMQDGKSLKGELAPKSDGRPPVQTALPTHPQMTMAQSAERVIPASRGRSREVGKRRRLPSRSVNEVGLSQGYNGKME